MNNPTTVARPCNDPVSSTTLRPSAYICRRGSGGRGRGATTTLHSSIGRKRKPWAVFHRRNRTSWRVTLGADAFLALMAHTRPQQSLPAVLDPRRRQKRLADPFPQKRALSVHGAQLMNTQHPPMTPEVIHKLCVAIQKTKEANDAAIAVITAACKAEADFRCPRPASFEDEMRAFLASLPSDFHQL